jgi:hypothetical protein
MTVCSQVSRTPKQNKINTVVQLRRHAQVSIANHLPVDALELETDGEVGHTKEKGKHAR